MTLLGTAAIVGAQYRAAQSSTLAATTRTSLAAESAVNLAIALLLQEPEAFRAVASKFPLRCGLPGGESAVITLEDEAGKIDLNAAKPALLALLFSRLSGNADEGALIADRIVQVRQGPKGPTARGPTSSVLPANATAVETGNPLQATSESRPVNTATSGFLSILQLDQIAGIRPAVFRAARPHLTVRSGRSDPSPNATSARLRRLLNLAASSPAPASDGRSLAFTIRADVTARDGARFIREAVVSFGSGTRPFDIHEWRRGDIDAPLEPIHKSAVQSTGCLKAD